MAITQAQYDAANQRQTTITQIDDILAAFPEEIPDPVTLPDIQSIVNTINGLANSFTDPRIIEAVNDALGTCYEAIEDNLTALKATVTDEFEAVGDQLDTPTSFNAVEGNEQVALTWDAGQYGSIFKMDMATDAGFSDATEIYSGTESEFTKTELANGTAYYFRVKATQSGYEDSEYATDSATPLNA